MRFEWNALDDVIYFGNVLVLLEELRAKLGEQKAGSKYISIYTTIEQLERLHLAGTCRCRLRLFPKPLRNLESRHFLAVSFHEAENLSRGAFRASVRDSRRCFLMLCEA